MAGATLADTQRALRRGNLDPVYYLTGEEDLLKDEFVSLLIEQAVDEGTRDFNLDVRSAGALDAESLNALVETPPMLADRRVAVVRNLEQWRKNSKPWKMLIRYLERPSPTTTLVLLHGAGQAADTRIANRATHVEVDAGDAATLRAWATRRADTVGLELEEPALTHILEATDHSLSRLASEIDKLAAATSGTGPLDVETVGRYLGVHRGETTNDWIDAVLRRDVVRSVDLLDVVLAQAGVSAVRLLMSLGTALVGVRLARAHLDAGQSPSAARNRVFKAVQAARPVGLGRYSDAVARWLHAAERWSGPDLDRAIEELYLADQRLKASTLSDDRGTLRSMLLTFGTPGNPR